MIKRALFDASICDVFWGGGAEVFPPFLHGLFLGNAVPELCQVSGDDKATFGATVTLEDPTPRIVFREFGFNQDRLVGFGRTALGAFEGIAVHGFQA